MKMVQMLVFLIGIPIIGLQGHNFKKVDFDKSMGTARLRAAWFSTAEVTRMLKFLKDNYAHKITLLDQPAKTPIIPKIIHQIWVGPKQPPAIFKESQESILKHHPDWEYKLWTDKEVASLQLENRKYYEDSLNYGEKADIVRYEILKQCGGVYLDIDMVVLQPLDILCHTYEFFCCLMPFDCNGIISNGIIGSAPNHPILNECIENIGKQWNAHKNKQALIEIMYRTGPILFHNAFLKHCKLYSDTCIAFPASYCFPLSYSDFHQTSKNHYARFIKEESFAIHYWACSWTT